MLKAVIRQLIIHHGNARIQRLRCVRVTNAQHNRVIFETLLEYLARLRESGSVWFALPGEVNQWWRQRSKMRLIRHGSDWKVEGKGSERARIAYAGLLDGKLTYRIDPPHSAVA